MSGPSLDIFFDNVRSDEVGDAYAIEVAGFPEDEAADLEKLRYRQSVAPELFLGAYIRPPSSSGSKHDRDRQLIGYICSTCTLSPKLTHDSMSRHDVPSHSPEESAYNVAIHSVCVSTSHRRKHVATGLLKEYLSRLRSSNSGSGSGGSRGWSYGSALLICHEELRGLYEGAGFVWEGESEVVHGSRAWFDMRAPLVNAGGDDRVSLAPSSSSVTTLVGESPSSSVVKPNKPETRRNPGESYDHFADPSKDLVVEGGRNRYPIYCPVSGCRSLLALKGAAEWVDGRDDGPLNDPIVKPTIRSPDFPPQPTPSSSPSSRQRPFWSLPSALSFENIGFSKTLPSQPGSTSTTPGTIKYLSCADCDTGPLGYHDTMGGDLGREVEEEASGRREVGGGSGREFLLGVDRVRYKVV